MSKLCIIGLDALEYNLVEKWDLDVLKQEEYGKVDLSPAFNDELGKTPVSPVVWSSFLTGEPADVHGVSSFSWDLPFSDLIYKLPTPQIGLESLILEKLLGRRKDFPDKEEINSKTFIDQLGEKFIGVNVPMYEFSFKKRGEVLHNDERGVGDLKNESLSKRKEVLYDYAEEVKKNVLQKINSNWDILFVYWYFIDGIQHHFYMNEDTLRESYKKACNYVDEIKGKLDDDTLVLIVSDHGNQLEKGNGNHSKHGFYSLSESRGLKNPKITDFYDFIMSEVNMPTKNDEKEIEDTLRSLGYLE